jgi:cytoplasmic iron level regulating protein YaaA (DUF328/UPF0246 family)
MLIILSPAKTLDFDEFELSLPNTLPEFIPEAGQLITELKKLSTQEIAAMMSLSDKLAALNAARYSSWSKTFTNKNSKAALFAFNGDVYEGLDATSLNKKQLDFAQKHLRILSGLYGVLKPLDLMQAYRLEMGTRLQNKNGIDLYSFWGSKITKLIQTELANQKKPMLLNLASEEYFKVIQAKELGYPIISPVFQDEKDGKFKIISFYAKRARGLMARYVIQNSIQDPIKLQGFDLEGYQYVESLSQTHQPVFQRKLQK